MGAATSNLPSHAAMAAPPPPLPPVPLADLPGDIQRLILACIPCCADLGRMSLVCHAWREMILGHGDMLPPPPLPLLLLPADPFDVRGVRAACVLSGGRVHHSLAIAPPNARFFGSHDGAWIFLATLEPRAHVTLNIRSGDTRAMPSELLRWTDPQRYVHGMVVHAAALTTSPEEESCVGAAIVTSWPLSALGTVDALVPRRRCVALWRQDGLLAYDYVVPGDEEDDSLDPVEDVVCLDVGDLRAFAFLTRREHLLMCTPILHDNDGLETIWKPVRFRPSGSLYDQHVRARYLVESDGELLMVVRFTPHPNQPTSKFKVFQATQRDGQEADHDPSFPVADYAGSWTELATLSGRILFVGHGCSRSYQAANYPGFKEALYFLDDGDLFDDVVIFGNGNVRRYPCSDNGKWSEGPVERCFPSSEPSDHSAPVWLLP